MNRNLPPARAQRPRATVLTLLTVCTGLACAGSGALAATAAALAIAGKPVETITAGTYYTFTPAVTDAHVGRTLRFSIANKPPWAYFNASTGMLVGRPTTVGAFSAILIRVSDGIGSAALPPFTVVVTPDPLKISGRPSTTATVGSPYRFTPSVSDSRRAAWGPLFGINGKPSWAKFDSRSGTLSGTPMARDVGAYRNINIAVFDGHGSAALPAFTLTVRPVAGTAEVTISGTPPRSVTAGDHYSFKPTATSTAGSTVSYSVRNKPAWAAFSIATGLLAGTPAGAQTGTYPGIVISASDGKASAALPAFSISVNATPPKTTMLSQKHPGDVGLGSDPAVVFYENFEEGNIPAVLARYNTTKHSAGMSLVEDHPPDGPGSRAMQFTSGGSNANTYLYKSFGAGHDELYFRYYIKYMGAGPWHHSGLWIGGYNPPLPWPYPHAGERPAGDDRYSIALEPITSLTPLPLDFYIYWRGMHSWMADPTGAVGDYWGNTVVHDAQLLVQSDSWVCYEIHLKLNPDPANGTGAVLELWKNDALVRRFDDSGPLGFWVRDKFCPIEADDRPCTLYRPANPALVLLDQRWRTTAALKINYFWPANYNNSTTDSSLRLDDMVVATERIGCTVRR